jgi:hypothetical protein
MKKVLFILFSVYLTAFSQTYDVVKFNGVGANSSGDITYTTTLFKNIVGQYVYVGRSINGVRSDSLQFDCAIDSSYLWRRNDSIFFSYQKCGVWFTPPGIKDSIGGGSGSSSAVGCGLSNSGVQSIPNATWTAVTFDTESWDNGGYHSTSSNTSRITIPSGKDGVYLFTANVVLANAGGTYRYIKIYKNGSAISLQNMNNLSGDVAAMGYSMLVKLAATDYIEVFVLQDSGGSINTNTTNGTPTFSAVYYGQ